MPALEAQSPNHWTCMKSPQRASVNVSCHYFEEVYTDQCHTLVIKDQKNILPQTFLLRASEHERGILSHETALTKADILCQVMLLMLSKFADMMDEPGNCKSWITWPFFQLEIFNHNFRLKICHLLF